MTGMDDHEALESLVHPGVSRSEKRASGLLRLDGEQRYSPSSTLSGQLRQCSTLAICLVFLISGLLLGLVGGLMLTLRDSSFENRAQHPSLIYGHCESRLLGDN
jgi:hypothetical protein